MATEKQLAANRANAQKSTGPKTDAGKARSRRNSYKHGLLSRELILPWEEERDFRKLVNALIEDHHPEGATELLLVEQMAVATWKLARLNGIERATLMRQVFAHLQAGFNPGKDSEEKFLHALSHALPKNQQVLLNHETLLQRSYYRALHMLKQLQRQRKDTITVNAGE